MMHFAIVGSGAVGGYFGAKLAQSGEQVTFIARNEHLKAMQTRGLSIKSIYADFHLSKVTATNDYSKVQIADVILIAVKSFQLKDALNNIKVIINENTRIIPLLNGVSAIELLSELRIPTRQTYGGLAKVISEVESAGVINHKGAKPHITCGLNKSQRQLPDNQLREEVSRLENIALCFKQAGVSIGISQNIDISLWRKFIFVGAWGAIASLNDESIGLLREGDKRVKLIAIIDEYALIGNSLGVDINEAMKQEVMKFIDLLPEKSKTSMQRDISNRRKGKLTDSEFEVLVKYPYFMAKSHQLKTPVLNECYEAIQAKLTLIEL